ncbi:MAG: acyl-CoA thioesterase [Saprospiraceae bacterium]|nr:acyl-CoA thioesterase [Saprospiraceae bacterium]MBK7812188.1 acyl-CoA thioesterase [Saprospiraceae bacterium]MBK9632593.1 acyl-CoA thioesterase [Saprospiraceae bacterium]
MFKHQTAWRVRYAETDRMGYVYYGNYAMYYETGRVEALRSLGLIYQKLEDDLGVFMPVMSMQCKFIRPCYYDELLSFETSILEVPDSTIQFHTDILKEDGKLANKGVVTLCFVEKESKKRIPVPPFIVDLIKPWIGVDTESI